MPIPSIRMIPQTFVAADQISFPVLGNSLFSLLVEPLSDSNADPFNGVYSAGLESGTEIALVLASREV